MTGRHEALRRCGTPPIAAISRRFRLPCQLQRSRDCAARSKQELPLNRRAARAAAAVVDETPPGGLLVSNSADTASSSRATSSAQLLSNWLPTNIWLTRGLARLKKYCALSKTSANCIRSYGAPQTTRGNTQVNLSSCICWGAAGSAAAVAQGHIHAVICTGRCG